MRVSTTFCSASMPSSAWRIRLAPSNWNGLVTTPTVSTPSSRAACAMIGAAPVPVPPPMPAVMKHMCAPARWSTISSIVSSADIAPTVGLPPAPRPSVALRPIWIFDAALLWASACASVLAATNSTPSRFLSIMLLTALPPAPPTPNTVIRGFSSSRSLIIRFNVIALPACPSCSACPARYAPALGRVYPETAPRSRKKHHLATKCGPWLHQTSGILPLRHPVVVTSCP